MPPDYTYSKQYYCKSYCHSGRVPAARIEGLSRLRFKAAKESWALACGLVTRGGKGKVRY